MRYFIRIIDRLCVAVSIASAAASCFADEPAARVEVPSGYEDAPEPDDAPQAPIRDSINLDAFDEAAMILDEVVDANVRRYEEMYLSRFQRFVTTERSFMLRACLLDKKQQSRISEVSDRCAKIASRQYAFARRRVSPIRDTKTVRADIARTRTDASGAVAHLLLLSVDELLSAEQKARYAEEDQKRKDCLKQTTVLNLVALMDKRLVLTVGQREQVAESLTKNWDPSWVSVLRYLAGNSEYLPHRLDEHVVKFLDDKQKSLWQGIQKSSLSSSLGAFGVASNAHLINDEFAVLEEDGIEEDAVKKDTPRIDEQAEQGRQEN